MNSKKLTAYAPLPIRILAGITFVVYGFPKISTQHLFSHVVGLPVQWQMDVITIMKAVKMHILD